MVTYEEYRFALDTINSEELAGLPWELLLPGEQRAYTLARVLIREYEQQQALLAAEEGEHDFPF